MENWEFDYNGRTYMAILERDDCLGAPWEVSDCHGIVSEWTTRDKMPGELVLCQDRRARRYYDFAEACKIARRDGWDAKPYNTDGRETKRQQAAKAARADYEYLREWCNDAWCYVVLTVTTTDGSGDYECLGGIESNCGDYLKECAQELAAELSERQDARHVESIAEHLAAIA